MQLLIISDIHGNLSALCSVINDVQSRFSPDAVIILGDIIDYGMRSNEVIDRLQHMELPVICSIWGNHEHAIMTECYDRFSSVRGMRSAQRTGRNLSDSSRKYIDEISGRDGFCEAEIDGRLFLAVHGSIQDPYWGKIGPEADHSGYEKYDYVLSGHTHLAHAFPVFYKTGNARYRNQKRTFFINPGSVGQPRNHDNRAQYAILDDKYGISLCGADYDIAFEQSLYTDEVDPFYRDRLSLGI